MSFFYTISTKWYDFKRYLEYTPKYKLVFTGLIILMLIYLIWANARISANNDKIASELIVARKICEDAKGRVIGNIGYFKKHGTTLEDLEATQPPTRFKYIQYPKIVYRDGVFQKVTSLKDLNTYCEIIDPRSRSIKYYYRFKTGEWLTPNNMPYHP